MEFCIILQTRNWLNLEIKSSSNSSNYNSKETKPITISNFYILNYFLGLLLFIFLRTSLSSTTIKWIYIYIFSFSRWPFQTIYNHTKTPKHIDLCTHFPAYICKESSRAKLISDNTLISLPYKAIKAIPKQKIMLHAAILYPFFLNPN